MDASGFIDSTKVSRSEARALIKDIESARDPMEKFAVEQDRLKRALDEGAISQELYNRLLDSKRPAIEGVTSSLHPYGIALGVVTAGITAASAATVAFIGHMRTVQGVIDDQADAAQRLGVSYTELKSLQFGFKEGGGVDAQTVSDSVKKLQINMAKAVEGDETTRAAFAKLGLDAGQLMGAGPREAMMQIASAMEGVNSHAERLKLSMELFGKSGADLASTLGQGAESLAESVAYAEKWASLTDSQVAGVGLNNDAWDRISVVVEGTIDKVAAELAPAFQIVADAILAGADSLSGVDGYIKNAVTTATMLVGVFMDGLDIVNEINELLGAAASLDFERLKQGINPEATSMDKTLSAWATLEANRKKAMEEAEQAEKKRQEARQAQAMEDTEKQIKAKEDAQKRLADEEKRRQQELEREQRRMAENAMKAAEKHFEDEIKRQEKMRADVAKGPGSGMETGSAEAARFMAQQANQAIAEATVGVDAKPTDQQLVEQGKLQVELERAAQVKRDEMIARIREVKTAIEENGFEAV